MSKKIFLKEKQIVVDEEGHEFETEKNDFIEIKISSLQESSNFPPDLMNAIWKFEENIKRNYDISSWVLNSKQLKMILNFNRNMEDAYGYYIIDKIDHDTLILAFVVYNDIDAEIWYSDLGYNKINLAYTIENGKLIQRIKDKDIEEIISLSRNF